MLEGKIYNSNLYAITDFRKTIGSNSISKIEKIIKILLKTPLKLNFFILLKNINAGMKFINHT